MRQDPAAAARGAALIGAGQDPAAAAQRCAVHVDDAAREPQATTAGVCASVTRRHVRRLDIRCFDISQPGVSAQISDWCPVWNRGGAIQGGVQRGVDNGVFIGPGVHEDSVPAPVYRPAYVNRWLPAVVARA